MEDQKKNTPANFIATVYGELIPLNNSGYSKSRLKIFYPGLNRNGTYITEKVAMEMISTLPGTPVVGYYDIGHDDFLDHMSPSETRAMGFVPDTMNFAWELHLDPDGVYRKYACADVVLWTSRYPEASKIVGKSHSMELNPDTISGTWDVVDGEFCFKYTKAEFFGLCVLGDQVEPCFEGSSFYSLRQKITNSKIIGEFAQMKKTYYDSIETPTTENINGGQEMEKDKEEIVKTTIDSEVNPSATAADKEIVETLVVETNSTAGINTEEVTAEETTIEENIADEKEEIIEEVIEAIETTEVENSEAEESIVEGQEPTSEEGAIVPEVTAKESVEDYSKIIADKDTEIASLKAEILTLQTYKANKLKEEKTQVLETFKTKLSSEEYSSIESNLESFANIKELKKEIGLIFIERMNEEEEAEENASNNFSLVNSGEQLTGAAAIVARYTNK